MAVLRSIRFTVAPDLADDMPARRAGLIAATLERFDGLAEMTDETSGWER